VALPSIGLDGSCPFCDAEQEVLELFFKQREDIAKKKGIDVKSSEAKELLKEDTQKLNQNLEVLAQSAIQNQYSLSSVMKLFTSNSMMEKIRILEREEQKRLQQAQQQSQQEMQLKQQELEQKQALEQAKMEQEYKMNQENNDTRVLVAEINSQAEADRLALMNKDDGIQEMSEEARARIKEMAREHDDNTKLAQQRLAFDKDKAEKDRALKAKIAASKPKTPANK
jgi:hypothetical protein